jgi:hypothetical protein
VPASRRTFVVVVHEPPDGVMVEDVRLRRRKRLGDVSELGAQLTTWISDGEPAESPDQEEET